MQDGDKALEAFYRYADKFNVFPDVTIIRMNDENSKPFIDAVDNAVNTGKPITQKEWNAIDYEVFGDTYDPSKGRLT